VGVVFLFAAYYITLRINAHFEQHLPQVVFIAVYTVVMLLTLVSFGLAVCMDPGKISKGYVYELSNMNRISAALYRQACQYMEFEFNQD
jgi:hypothetical protein